MAEPTSMSLGTPIVLGLSSSSAQTAAIGAANSGQPNGTTTCRLVATVDAWLAVGGNPTASVGAAGSFLLPAGAVEYVDITWGQKIAGIAGSVGSLSVTPASKI